MELLLLCVRTMTVHVMQVGRCAHAARTQQQDVGQGRHSMPALGAWRLSPSL